MLYRSKSNRLPSWNYSLVIPLFAFVLGFNTETIAQTKDPSPEKVKIGQNILKFTITKDTKDSQLESIKDKLADKEATITFDNIIRNDRKEITGIKIDFTHAGKKGNFFINSDNPIKDIAVSLNMHENELTVGQSTTNLSQSFEIITEDGDKKIKTSGSGGNVFVYSTDDDDENIVEKVVVIGKDGEEHEVKKEKKVYVIKSDVTKDSDGKEDAVFIKKSKKDTVWINKDVKNIVWTDDDGSDVEIIAVENGNNFRIITTGEEQPLILLDGKEISKKDMEKVKPETIENVNVLKGEKAIEKHGQKAEHGVIEITSKKD
ncbi:MAG TPA: hypothetical protein VKZ98_09130 [Aquaticitalea sp.]|nr:hypothetical protein [Aquaticitalea sp.]